MEEAAAKVFELAEKVAGSEAGDAGSLDGGDTEACGRETGDVRAEGAVELGALPLVFFADTGLAIGVMAGAARAGFAMDAPTFFESANTSALSVFGWLIQPGESSVQGDADEIVFKEETF